MVSMEGKKGKRTHENRSGRDWVRYPTTPFLLRGGAGINLVVRIARPASLAIWHRWRSRRRPNRSESPIRKRFASLGLKKHADISHRGPTSQDFRREFSAIFL